MAKTYKREQGLTIEQLNAIDLLVTGKSDQEVADKVGVNRVTVTSWRLYDPYFQAELNRRRKEIWGASVDRMRALLPKAFDVLEQAINNGDVKAALELIKMAGLDMGKDSDLGIYGIGKDNAEAIIEDKAKEKSFDMFGEVSDFQKKAVIDELNAMADRLLQIQQKGI